VPIEIVNRSAHLSDEWEISLSDWDGSRNAAL
jgi:hypothetical protein